MSNSPQHEKQYLIDNYTDTDNGVLAEKLGISRKAVVKRARRLGLSKNCIIKKEHIKTTQGDEMEKKIGVESRCDDKAVINWTTKTILTDLGEFGQFTCNFSTHGAIQRYYVDGYEGKGHTSAEVAMKFNFPHAKAVLLYAKIHGFTKASPPQTDIEFEEGLTVEEAVEENIQAMKRATVRKTEIAKWRKVQEDANKWNNFENAVLYPMKDQIEQHLPKYKPVVYEPQVRTEPVTWVIGFNDWHYRKFCYNHKGQVTYNKKIAEQALKHGVQSLVTRALLHGKPESIFITAGGDNLTTDNKHETTTSGTSQIGQVEGVFEIDLEKYIDTTVSVYDTLGQIAHTTIIPTLGNHDESTSRMLLLLLSKLYESNDNIDVLKNLTSRTFCKYGNNGLGFAHGQDMSLAKWKRNAHKLFLVEAREQGVNLNTTQNLFLFLQHLHTDMREDMGGVQVIVLPAPPPPDSWHRGSGYIGNYIGMSLHIINKKTGQAGGAVLYS